ncbi:MAG: hypothetical protein V1663_04595 [archaeon]
MVLRFYQKAIILGSLAASLLSYSYYKSNEKSLQEMVSSPHHERMLAIEDSLTNKVYPMMHYLFNNLENLQSLVTDQDFLNYCASLSERGQKLELELNALRSLNLGNPDLIKKYHKNSNLGSLVSAGAFVVFTLGTLNYFRNRKREKRV